MALIDALDALRTTGTAALGPLHGASADDRELAFVAALTDLVAPPAGTVTDAVLRRSVAASARQLLGDDDNLRDAVRSGTSDSYRIGGDLLCDIYAFFFADAVKGLLQTVLAEHLKLAFPVLYVDPTGHLARLIVGQILKLVPDPCAEQERRVRKPRTIADAARDLVDTTVTRIFDLGEQSLGAA